MLESFFNKVAGRKASLYLKETWTRVFLWILRNFLIVKPPVASVDLLFLIKSNVGWFLLQRVDLVIVRVIYTLLVETIPTRFYWLTRKNEKLVQNKPLQQRLFDLILGFWHFFYILIANVSWTVAQTPINHIIFWKTVMKTFRSIYVNYFNTLRFLAEVSTKLQKMHFFGQFKDHKSERKHGNYINDPRFSSAFSALTGCDIHFYISKWSKFIFMWSPLLVYSGR